MAIAHPRTSSSSISQQRWLPTMRDLSEEQLKIVNARFTKTAIVYGPAGAGKTALIAYRAWNLCKAKETFKIFVFTNELVNFIQAAIEELGIPDERVQSFYSWAWHEYRARIGFPPTRAYDLWVSELTDYYTSSNTSPPYSYILVDEAQDFKPDVARLIRLLAKNIFITGDGAQSLYTNVKSSQEFASLWKPVDSQMYLTHNYRNPKSVAHVAAHFLTDPAYTREQFMQMVKGRPNETRPVWHQVSSPDQQSDTIASIIKQARGQERIGVLFEGWDQLREEARRLDNRDIGYWIAEKRRGEHCYNSSIPVLSTIHSAKGLEFDWVIIPDLNRDVWDEDSEKAKQRRLFFVALTRTKDKLHLISQKGRECRYLKEIPADLLQIPNTGSAAVNTAQQSAMDWESDDDDLPF